MQARMEEARKELGDAPKQIEHLQRLVIKRDDKIKDLEDEAQTLRMILKGRVQTGAAAQAEASQPDQLQAELTEPGVPLAS